MVRAEVPYSESNSQITDLRRERMARGAINVSVSALIVAYDFTKKEMEEAQRLGNFADFHSWRSEYNNIGAALRGDGLTPPEKTSWYDG